MLQRQELRRDSNEVNFAGLAAALIQQPVSQTEGIAVVKLLAIPGIVYLIIARRRHERFRADPFLPSSEIA